MKQVKSPGNYKDRNKKNKVPTSATFNAPKKSIPQHATFSDGSKKKAR